MSEPSLPDKVVAIDRCLDDAGIAHAFGGALALAYYAEPRATIDVDLNVFAPPSEHASVIVALAPLGVTDTAGPRTMERDGQGRVHWGRTPIDLFFAYDAVHSAMQQATRTVDFGDHRLPILGPEHLIVCKAVFDRPKDWLDIEQMLVTSPELDLDEVGHWLDRIVGVADLRAERFAELARSA